MGLFFVYTGYSTHQHPSFYLPSELISRDRTRSLLLPTRMIGVCGWDSLRRRRSWAVRWKLRLSVTEKTRIHTSHCSVERSCESQTHTCIIQTPWWSRPVCTRKKRDQVTAEQVWNVRCLLTITEDCVACHQQPDHLSFNCFLKLPLQCLLVCLFKAMGRASTLFPSTQIFITVPREDSEGALLNLTMRMSCFTLNCLTLLKVSTNIPSGLPVTEAQLARVALAETAACNCRGPCLPSIAFPLDSVGCVYIGLKVVQNRSWQANWKKSCPASNRGSVPPSWSLADPV